jgi:photosystem II stability/assembly factor-like uncharacterized protein
LKKTTLIFLHILILSIAACDKDNDAANPDPVSTKSDTLGVGWSQQKVSRFPLLDVFFQDSLVGYVGGDSVYKTNNGGTTWIRVPDSSGVMNFFVTPDGALHALNTAGTVYKKFTNWAENNTNTVLGSNGRGNDLYFTSSNNGFLTTDRGLLKTTNGGHKWEPVVNTTGLNVQNYAGLAFLDSTTGWLFTGDKIFRTNGTITNWVICNMPVSQVGTISGMHVVSATTIYAITFSGKILKSSDRGQHFTEAGNVTTPPENNFCDIYFLDDLHGYACYGQRIYQTNDGGHNWNRVVGMAESSFIELHFTDRNHGWACTMDGKVLKYTR